MADRAVPLGLVGAVLAASAVSAQTAERAPSLSLSFDGSLPLSLSDNSYRNAAGRTTHLTSPYLRASAHGKLTPELSYSFYTSGGFEKYPSDQNSDNTFATLGTSLTRRWNDITVGAYYERNHAYDGIFGNYLYSSNDIGAHGSYSYTDTAKVVRLKPGFSISRRFADDSAEDSFVYSFKLDAERKMAKQWWLTLTPRIRRQHFLEGANHGRVDTIYSISSGVRYAINDTIQISGGIGYDHRESTMASKRYDSISFGISLDFSHTLAVFPR